jgi:NDP-sugar pyrophosphorylase family protein
MKAVILAGGKGTRLKPYTTVFPKPLMPIGDKPILEIIIRQLKSQGLRDIIISVGPLSELIMTFFGDGSQLGVNIKYSKEDEPLGTAGGLGLIKKELTDTFLMVNGDTLTTLNFSELIDYHKTSGAIATIALKKREVYIDFGIVELDNNNAIKGYTEKPTIYYLVSMGVYVFEPRVMEYIQLGEKLDFPDLVKTLISKGEKVNGFVFDGYWLDIGRPADYEKANEEIEELSKLLNI